MCNCFQKYFLENKSIDLRQFDSQVGQSNDLAIIQLHDQIFEAFKINLYTPGVFIDFRIAFQIVDHMILLKKL